MESLIYTTLGIEHLSTIIRLEPLIYKQGWSAKLIAAEFEKDISRRFGLLKDAELIGYSFGYLVVDEFHLLNIGVHPEYWGRGFGKRLLSYVLESAYSEGCKKCFLEVRKSNQRAQSLYLSSGFRSSGLRPKYYPDQEDAVLMDADLKS